MIQAKIVSLVFCTRVDVKAIECVVGTRWVIGESLAHQSGKGDDSSPSGCFTDVEVEFVGRLYHMGVEWDEQMTLIDEVAP